MRFMTALAPSIRVASSLALAARRAPLALALAAGLALPAHAGVITAHWLNPVAGHWTIASNWSSAPFFPNNNNPPGAAYHAIIDAPGADYTVDINSNIALHQFTLGYEFANVRHLGGVFSSDTGMNLNSGAFRLAGGTIANTHVINTGGVFTSLTDTHSVATNLTLTGALDIQQNSVFDVDGFSLADGIVRLHSAAGAAAQLRYIGNQTIGGVGEFVFDGADQRGQIRHDDASGTHTIGPGVVIRTGTGSGDVGGSIHTGLINQGVISSQTPGKDIRVTATNWRNEGLLRADGANLFLQGTIVSGGLGEFESVNGGRFFVSGTLNNHGHTLLLDAPTKRLELLGLISGGTVHVSNGGALSGYFSASLSDVTLKGETTFNFNQLDVGSTITLDGGVLRIHRDDNPNYSTPRLRYVGTTTFAGDGELHIDNNSGHFATIAPFNVGVFSHLQINTPLRLLQGTVVIGGPGSVITNNAVISAEAPGQSLRFASGAEFRNAGLLRAHTGAIVFDAGSTIVGSLGQFETGPTGTIELSGSLDLDGGALYVNDSDRRVVFAGATLLSGTLVSDPGATGRIATGRSLILDDVHLSVGFNLIDRTRLTLRSGVVLDDVTIGINRSTPASSSERIEIDGSQTIGGVGEIVFGGSRSDGEIRVLNAGDMLTIGDGVTIRSGTRGGIVGRTDAGLVNHGVIASLHANDPLIVRGENLINLGVFRATAGTLRIEGSVAPDGLGAIESVGSGVVHLAADYDLDSGTLALTNPSARLTFSNATISNGVILIRNGGAFRFAADTFDTTLDNITIDGNINTGGATVIHTRGALTLADSVVTLGSADGQSWTQFRMSDSPVINGSGVILLNANNNISSIVRSGIENTIEVGENVTIRTGIGGGFIGSIGAPLHNHGRFESVTPGRTLEARGVIINDGELRATNGVLRTVGTGLDNNGRIEAVGAGLVRLSSTNFAQHGVLEARSGGEVRVDSGQPLINHGALIAGAGGTFSLQSGFIADSNSSLTIGIAGLTAADYGRVTITGDASLTGELGITLEDGFAPAWGDSWEIITYGSRTGDFSLISTPTLADPNLAWWTDAGANAYTVGVRHIADINNDNAIDFADFSVVLAEYGMFGPTLSGDVNGDGVVDFTDFSIVLANYGAVATGSPATVPAPGALALFTLALIPSTRRRR